MSGTMSWTAGPTSTPPRPWRRRSAAACQMRSVRVRKRTAHRSETSMYTPWAIWMSLRQFGAVGERSGVDGEEQERHPVADDGEAAQRRRVKGPEDDPVADDVLDVLRDHAEQGDGGIATV